MRTSFDHLPATKQRDLDRVVQILFEEFHDATKLATGEKKAGRILKIILFGSYARDEWVDEPYTSKGYRSDFDLLVIVNQAELTDRVDYWATADERLIRELSVTKTLHTPVNFIVHTLQQVNDGLAHGRFFFIDIARDGIALYQSDESELHQPKPKTPEQALDLAREYFEEWVPSAEQFLETAKFAMGKGWSKKAAFLLHQATEHLYHAVMLVKTFYTPHTHNIAFLRSQGERLDYRLSEVWRSDRKKDRVAFGKLKDAYVKARYSKHYRINDDELDWLSERVEELGRTVHAICTEQIGALDAAMKANA